MQKYGKTFGLYEGLRKVLVTSDVDMINEVFVKQFDNFHGRKTNPMTGNPGKNQRTNVFIARGARWKRLRTITAPSFSNANLKKVEISNCTSSISRIGEFDFHLKSFPKCY